MRLLALVLLAACHDPRAGAGVLHVAVASNFATVCDELAADFTAREDVRVVLSTGSTGHLAAQLENGAPAEVFLAADRARPAQLVAAGLAESDSLVVYALGRLALFAPGSTVPPESLAAASFTHLAVPSPEVAPYGRAALEVLSHTGALAACEDRIVRGENVAQTLRFVEAGAAELGFVALSQVLGREGVTPVEDGLHEPIEQCVVLLRDAGPAARSFHAFLTSEAARVRIVAAGYSVPER